MRILITGATRGIGRGLAERYLGRGEQVIAIGRSRERLEELKERWGERVEVYQTDLADLEQVAQLGRGLKERGERIDMAIFNAGISLPHAPDFTPFPDFFKVFTVNFLSIHLLLEQILELIPERGRIVLISSLASIIASPTSLPYSASKRALNSYGESLYYLLRDRSVITILPGFIKTDMTAGHNFKMPFLMELEEALDRIGRAIEKRIPFYPFPYSFYLILRGLGMLPFPVRKWLFGKIVTTHLSE